LILCWCREQTAALKEESEWNCRVDRVIALDRRGHGRSDQTWEGNDMDHCADDLAELTEKLDLRDALHVGHSTGGGEVARYMFTLQTLIFSTSLIHSGTATILLSTIRQAAASTA